MVDRRRGAAVVLAVLGLLGPAGCGGGPAGAKPESAPSPRRTGVLESTIPAMDALPSAGAMVSLDRRWQTADEHGDGWTRPDVVDGRSARTYCRGLLRRDCPGLTMLGGAGYDLTSGSSVRATATFTLYVFGTADAARGATDTLRALAAKDRPTGVQLRGSTGRAFAYRKGGRTVRIESVTRTGTVVTVVDYRARPATTDAAGTLVTLQDTRLRTVLAGRQPAL